MEQPRVLEPILSDHGVKSEYIRNQDTQFLLKEFETVYDAVGYTHDTLTPPQSPPGDQKILTTLEPLLTPLPDKHPATFSVPEKQLLPTVLTYRPTAVSISDYTVPSTPQPDIAHELAVVDELVRTRVEDMQWSSPSSPNGSSGSSNFGDCSSDDPEWMPESIENYDEEESPKSKRPKPYSRTSGTDKKSRKKEQNKNAATRYRMKKKAEVEVILGEEKGLSDKNDELRTEITDMVREIKYLKGLMRDLCKAKGLIN